MPSGGLAREPSRTQPAAACAAPSAIVHRRAEVDRELPLRELPARDGRAAHHLCRYPAERFAYVAGEPVRFHSSPGVTRAFCGRCGTPLTYEGDRWPGEVHVLTGSMDRPEDLVPARDAYAEEKLPWVPMAPSRGR